MDSNVHVYLHDNERAIGTGVKNTEYPQAKLPPSSTGAMLPSQSTYTTIRAVDPQR